MFDPSTAARSAVDEALRGESIGECSECLIALECLDGQRVRGGAWDSTDGAQGIPLSKRCSRRGKPGVERAVMPVLHLLDGASQRF